MTATGCLLGGVEDLAAVLEPLELKAELREALLGRTDTWPATAGAAERLAGWLWDRWAPTLEEWGYTPGGLAEVAAGYRQEVWLWLVGERTWESVSSGLAGRARRRAPAPSR